MLAVTQIELLGRRCSVKACPFPTADNRERECAHHHRMRTHPKCFESQTCSFAMLTQAIYGLPTQEPDDGRMRDRNRLRNHIAQLRMEAA